MTTKRGIGFLGALGLLFIALKLTHQIDWAWWIVLSPLWACPVVFVAGCVAVFLVILSSLILLSGGAAARALFSAVRSTFFEAKGQKRK